MSTEWMTDPMPPESTDWATLSRQSVEVHGGSEIYRCGHMDETISDGSGLWMAADGILGREPIWREQGFTVGKLRRPAGVVQLQLDAGSSHASVGHEEPRIAGDRS